MIDVVWGINGTERLRRDVQKQLAEHPGDNNVSVDARTIIPLMDYHQLLTTLCQHEWDYGSPIDVGICRKCGVFEK